MSNQTIPAAPARFTQREYTGLKHGLLIPYLLAVVTGVAIGLHAGSALAGFGAWFAIAFIVCWRFLVNGLREMGRAASTH